MTNRLPAAIQERLSLNIRRVLLRKRWKAEHIHKNSDVDKGNLSRFLNGHRDYTLFSLTRIADVLQVDISELFKPLPTKRK